MSERTIGILHPGQMGISVAASAQNSGCEVVWVSEDRSPETASRANQYQLLDAKDIETLVTDRSDTRSDCGNADQAMKAWIFYSGGLIRMQHKKDRSRSRSRFRPR